MPQLTIQWDENYKKRVPPSLDTLEKVGTLIGRTFESLEEIAQEIDTWKWKRIPSKESTGNIPYCWHHPTGSDTVYFPNEIRVSITDFPNLKRWPIIYHNLNYGTIYNIAQIEVI